MKDHSPPSVGSVTLIGSGEMSPSMSKVHRMVMNKIRGPVHPVFLDTPAGFQLNVDQISTKALEYFKKHFNLDLPVASFKSSDVPQPVVDSVLARLRTANYIFAGPGSPTYAVRNWKNTPIPDALYSRLTAGAHLVFASAASIAIGSHALPVYEVYKVGDAPFWVKGLNFLHPFGYEPAIVPHWNNTEGGTHDTRFCYMGKPRWTLFETLLPSSVIILGIDEYTAVTLDFSQNLCHVVGSGSAILRNKNREITFPSGGSFNMSYLRDFDAAAIAYPGKPEILQKDIEFPHPDPLEQPEKIGEAQKIPLLFIELLIRIRSQLRKEGKWDIADEIREKLSEFGIMLEDDSQGTTWRKID